MQTFKHLALGALLFGTTAGAGGFETPELSLQATCNCKGKGDCTCPKGECKCKNCGNGAKKARVYDALKGSNQTTRLPDTARLEAHGGVFI